MAVPITGFGPRSSSRVAAARAPALARLHEHMRLAQANSALETIMKAA